MWPCIRTGTACWPHAGTARRTWSAGRAKCTTKSASRRPPKSPLPPVFAAAPVYDVGHVGKEYAYANTWLVKTKQGGFLLDTGGVSGIPYSLQRMKAAGIGPKDV